MVAGAFKAKPGVCFSLGTYLTHTDMVTLDWISTSHRGWIEWVPESLDTPEGLAVSLTGHSLGRRRIIAVLSWLTAALRHARSPRVAFSEVSFTRVNVSASDLSYDVRLKSLTTLRSGSLGSCWHALFKGTVIVSAKLSLDSKKEMGLHIDLQRLLHISGATIPLEFEGGLLLFGYSSEELSNILVPVEKSIDGSLLWHVISSTICADMGLSTIKDSCHRLLITDIDEITKAPKHRIGLWTAYKIILGTREANYTEVQWTTTQEKKTIWRLSSVSLPLNGVFPYGTVGVNPTFAVAKPQIRINPGEVHPFVLLRSFQRKPILLYDPERRERRAWLVPTPNFVLHVAHSYLRHFDLEDRIPFASAVADSGEAAMQALESCEDSPIFTTIDREPYKFSTWNLLQQIAMNIARVEAANASNNTIGNQLTGYEFGDIATLDLCIRLKKATRPYPFGSDRHKWNEYFSSRVSTIFCSGLGDIILPSGANASSGISVPRGKNLLIAPLRCLGELSSREGGEIKLGWLGQTYFLKSVHEPFGHCRCSRPCNRVQSITSESLPLSTDTGQSCILRYDCPDGVIVID